MALVLTHFTDVLGVDSAKGGGAVEVSSGNTLAMALGGVGEYSQLRITSDDGLPNNRVQALAQTDEGYLWVGTAFGLARFDGVQSKTFDHTKTLQFVDNSINALAKATDGSLWVGTSKGLLRYFNRNFERFGGENDALGNLEVKTLLASSTGGVWVGSRQGLYYLTPNSTNAAPMVPGVEVLRLMLLPTGTLLVQLPDRWMEYRATEKKLVTPTEEYSPGNVPAAILPRDNQGRRWAATADGIYQATAKTWKKVWSVTSDHRAQFTQVAEDLDGSVWFLGGPTGTLRMRDSEIVQDAFPPRTPARRATLMFIDREQVRWVATPEGLVQLHPRRAWSISDPLMSAAECRSMVEGVDGTIWVATAGGVDSIKDGKVQHRVLAEATGKGAIYSVAVDSAGTIWFGRDGVGLFRWVLGTNEEESVPLALASTQIRALQFDAAGMLWIGTEAGVACLKNGKLESVAGLEKLPYVPIRSIYAGADGSVWVGTKGAGAWGLKSGVVTPLVAREDPQVLGHDTVLSIAGDEDGGLWFGTLDGLTYRNGTNSISFNSKNGLKESVVHQILSASGGYLWVSGLHGVHRLELEGMKRRGTNGSAPMRCVTVGRADGMLSSETSGGQQPAGLVSKDGKIWVPTGQGVAMIDPKLVRENTNCPVAVIEAVYGPRGAKLLEDQHPPVVHTNTGVPRVWLSSKINPASRSMLEIHYTANTFVQPAEAQFEYRLLPLELNWRDPTTRRVAVYTRLTPGKYTFQLRSANSHGYGDAGMQELDFYVKAMPREEWWFWITVGALSSVGVGGLIRSRWRRQRENIRAEVTSLERERTRIARDLHDDVGANMTGLALKAQLAALEFPGEPSSKLQEIARDIRSLVDRMREVIWAVNPDCDTLENLVNYLTHYVEGFLTAAGCRCRLDVPAALPRLPVCAEARHNLLSVTKEALNNSVKHAEASEVLVRIAVDPTRLQLQIKDNGVGFNPDDTEIIRINGSGHGMGNMRKRIEDLRGKFTVRSSHGEGTDIVAELQLTDLAKVKNKSNGHNDTAASQRRSNQPQKYDRHSSPAQHR